MPSTFQNSYTYLTLQPLFRPQDAEMIHVALPASVHYLSGTILGEVTATLGTAKAYASGNVDGSQIAKYILPVEVATDAAGNITKGATAGSAPFGATQPTIEVYVRGAFKTSELVQAGAGSIDANAVTNLGAHLLYGTLVDGALQIP